MTQELHITAPGLKVDIAAEWWHRDTFERVAREAFPKHQLLSFHENILPGLLVKPQPLIPKP